MRENTLGVGVLGKYCGCLCEMSLVWWENTEGLAKIIQMRILGKQQVWWEQTVGVVGKP